jgi:hypothetical protein
VNVAVPTGPAEHRELRHFVIGQPQRAWRDGPRIDGLAKGKLDAVEGKAA